MWETSFEKLSTRFWYQESWVMSICAITGDLSVCLLAFVLGLPCSVHRVLELAKFTALWGFVVFTKFIRLYFHYTLFSNPLLKHKAMVVFIDLINLLINLGSCFHALTLPSVSVHNNFKLRGFYETSLSLCPVYRWSAEPLTVESFHPFLMPVGFYFVEYLTLC